MTTKNNIKLEIGTAHPDELPELLVLYRFLNPDDPVLTVDDSLRDHWEAILSNPALAAAAGA